MTSAATTGRLGPADSQAIFRSLLDATSRPGTVCPISLPDPVMAPPVLLPLALADVSTTVAVIGPDSSHWAEVIRLATGAAVAPTHDADHVVFLREPHPDELRTVRRGSLEHPELGATISVPVDGFDDGDPIVLTGPGVAGSSVLRPVGVRTAVFETLAAVNATFPTGVDTFLFSATWVAGIPRSSIITIPFEEEPWATPR